MPLYHLDARLDAAVESPVVGYLTITMEAGKWYMVGNPFKDLDDAETYTLATLFAGNSKFSDGDKLFVSNGGNGYKNRFWNAEEQKWSMNPRIFLEDTTVYSSKDAVYIHKAEEGSVTFSGKVSVDPVDFGTEEGSSWQLLTLPWPSDRNISDYVWSNCEDGDRLYIPVKETGSYKNRFWNATEKKWSTNPRIFIEATDTLEAGCGVFINKVSKGLGSVSVVTTK